MENNFVVIVFAKAPVPGEAKTRLIPAIGAAQAALMHAALTERAIVTAQHSSADDVELCCTPNSGEAFFQYCAEDFAVSLTEQGDGDLGQRMLRALNSALAYIEKVIIIGADCPALTAKHIQNATKALSKAEIVLMPAEDGGYVLIGATRTHMKMFDGIHWGTSTVLAEQHRNLIACGLTLIETETLWDVDRPEDLVRLKSLKPPLEFFWPE